MNVIRVFETRVSIFLICGSLLLAACGTLFAGETLTLTNSGKTGTGTVVGNTDTFMGTVGNWVISITQGQDLGTPSAPNLDLLTVDTAKVNSPGGLSIVFTETGFALAPLTLAYSDSASFLGTKVIKDTVSILINGKIVAGSSNILTPAVAGADGTVLVNPGSNYSISLTEDISALKAAGSDISSDILVGAETPEPGLYAVTGIGVAILLARVARRRKLASA
jgi:hypothetical protein